ncbi:hypothetical protein TrVE_jg10480 [Triparma verrucosa]|uniref:Ion transport domain-containing protein n=1 Tax=Triparma verrucosa TaxID=1606542 RepID=A0A9W7FHF0_9STRA|nr:hypothetical protein TrVE_jg10480 [Triparma verrucosa]
MDTANFRNRFKHRFKRSFSSPPASPDRKREKELDKLRTPTPDSPWWLIPSSSVYKITWDLSTLLISLYSFYLSIFSIHTRQYSFSEGSALIELWFLVDVLLNFVTEYKSGEGEVEGDGWRVFKRYAGSWFLVDFCGLVPWEVFWIQPIIEMQNNRSFITKSFFRTKGILKVTRVLRSRHFKIVSSISRRTSKIGYTSRRIVKGLIRYAPKYVQFLRNMKLVLPVRLLRGWHVCRRVGKDLWVKSQRVVVFVEDETEEEVDPSHPWRARASKIRRRFSRSVERVIELRSRNGGRMSSSTGALDDIKEGEGEEGREEDDEGIMSEKDSSIELAELILSEVRELEVDASDDLELDLDLEGDDFEMGYDEGEEVHGGEGSRRKSLDEVRTYNEELTGLVRRINGTARRNTVAVVGSPEKVSRSTTT